MNAVELTALLARNRFRFRFRDEYELQDGIELVLKRADVAFEREYLLPPPNVARHYGTGRIDFFIPASGLGVEVKVGGSLSHLTRQLWRYAEHPLIKELLVVSSRLSLRELPAVMEGRPVHVFVPRGEL